MAVFGAGVRRIGGRKAAFLVALAEGDQVRFAFFSEDYQVADLAAAFLIAPAEDDRVVVGERARFLGVFLAQNEKIGGCGIFST
ncbi:MAG: hypothetical protein ACTHN5_06105 [Phycisphaerae bacterium]